MLWVVPFSGLTPFLLFEDETVLRLLPELRRAWVGVQLLAPVTWAKRIWALPLLTVLAPSRRYYQQRGRAAKTLTDCARQVIMQVRQASQEGIGGRTQLFWR
jgi:hypothetical protein